MRRYGKRNGAKTERSVDTILVKGGNTNRMLAEILLGVCAIVLVLLIYQVYRLIENWLSNR